MPQAAVTAFLTGHAFTHADTVAPSAPYSLPETVWNHLSEDQLRAMPNDLNSIAWHVWHLAFTEDEGLSLIANLPRLFDEKSWAAELKYDRRNANRMTKADSRTLAESIDPDAVWNYRIAVGKRTRRVLTDREPEHWLGKLTAEDLKTAVKNAVYSQHSADATAGFLVGQPRIDLLGWWAHTHSLIHLGQATSLRHLLLA